MSSTSQRLLVQRERPTQVEADRLQSVREPELTLASEGEGVQSGFSIVFYLFLHL